MASRMFEVNAHRFDPYRTFKFRVLINKDPVAGLRKMTGLKKTTEVVTWRAAGDPSHERKLPGGTKYEPVTLEQGLTHDLVFEEWANLVNSIDGDDAMSLRGFRKEVVIKVLNLQGKTAIEYKLRGAWVSEFQALPDFDAGNTNTVGIQTIKIEHDGWERETSVSEPQET